MAAITLARAGWDVTVFEAASHPGGGMRSEELTIPGAIHDVCSAIHPLAVGSPAFREIAATGALAEHGLEWIHSDVPLAHPLDGGRAAVLHRSVDDTAVALGADASAYRRLFGPLVEAGFGLTDGLMSPFTIPPKHPLTMVRYGAVGLLPAHTVARRAFDTDDAQALFAGLAGHSILSLKAPVTAGYGLMLGVLAHLVGWPLARGGSQQIASALVAVLEGFGGRVECDHRVDSLAELPPNDAVLLDVTPRQVIALAGDSLPSRYVRTLTKFRYGPGVFKVDWALDGPIPWTNTDCAGPPPCTSVERSPRSPRPKVTSKPAGCPSGPTCCSRSRACSTPAVHRPARRRRGRTVMCRTDPPGHDGAYRVPGRTLRSRLP